MLRKVFWNPGADWMVKDGALIIEGLAYSEKFVELFPEFYFITQEGVKEEELYEHNKGFNVRLLGKFIKELKDKKILTQNVISPAELFYSQSKFIEDQYGEELLINQKELLKFKQSNYLRDYSKGVYEVNLDIDVDYPEVITNRRSCRDFSKEMIALEEFKKLCCIYKQCGNPDETTYYYPSAGGLYPIDIYYYIKADRVESLEEGIYYYNPKNNTLSLIKNCHIPKTAHYYTNQDIFESSAFSIFYFFNAKASFPKYGGLGYYYSVIDLGIMVELFNVNAEMNEYGICSIGEMQFEKIKDNFSLDSNQIYLHTVEAGKKNKVRRR